MAHNLNNKKYNITVISAEPAVADSPLLASAACGLLSFSVAENPIRRKIKAIQYLKAKVEDIDFIKENGVCSPAFDSMAGEVFEESDDYVIITPRCTLQTFKPSGVADNAFFIKNIKDAMAVRQRLENILKMASLPTMSEQQQRNLLHIAVGDGGLTG